MTKEQAFNNFYGYLDKNLELVLATSQDDFVTSRMVSTFRIDNKLYFQCDRISVKMQQMLANPKVSLCSGMYNMTGTAKVIGPTAQLLEDPLMLTYKEHYPGAYDVYSPGGNNLVEVEIEEVKSWRYVEGIPFEGVLNPLTDDFSEVRYILSPPV